MTELIVKHFNELTTNELYEIIKLRVSVFVVEQNCPYQELDGNDLDAYHLFLKDNDNILAYLRVFRCKEYKNAYLDNSETLFNVAAIGRVVSAERRKGYATMLLNAAVKLVKDMFNTNTIVLEAQVYASELYKKIGFVQTSDEFLEDGIPHIQMMLNC